MKNSFQFLTNFIAAQDGAVDQMSRQLVYLVAISIFFEKQKRQKNLSNISGIQEENVSIYLTIIV